MLMYEEFWSKVSVSSSLSSLCFHAAPDFKIENKTKQKTKKLLGAL